MSVPDLDPGHADDVGGHVGVQPLGVVRVDADDDQPPTGLEGEQVAFEQRVRVADLDRGRRTRLEVRLVGQPDGVQRQARPPGPPRCRRPRSGLSRPGSPRACLRPAPPGRSSPAPRRCPAPSRRRRRAGTAASWSRTGRGRGRSRRAARGPRPNGARAPSARHPRRARPPVGRRRGRGVPRTAPAASGSGPRLPSVSSPAWSAARAPTSARAGCGHPVRGSRRRGPARPRPARGRRGGGAGSRSSQRASVSGASAPTHTGASSSSPGTRSARACSSASTRRSCGASGTTSPASSSAGTPAGPGSAYGRGAGSGSNGGRPPVARTVGAATTSVSGPRTKPGPSGHARDQGVGGGQGARTERQAGPDPVHRRLRQQHPLALDVARARGGPDEQSAQLDVPQVGNHLQRRAADSFEHALRHLDRPRVRGLEPVEPSSTGAHTWMPATDST